ncbi:hypothetical protein [Aureimonas mangrovi]|uniref:hypothetical protein n=1 Tax=Aureimonas mangrovi TaxID=2758041 RepID=UPI00163D757E|nr:hypothetical protein [Aureimonas mangrovi]
MRGLAPFVLVLLITAPAFAATLTGAASPIGERFCGPSVEAEGVLRCPGPSGVEAYIHTADGLSSISLGDPVEGYVSFGETNSLGATMEWRLSDGLPFAGVVRFRLPAEAAGEGTRDLMAVIKVAEGGRASCLVAVVDLTVNPEGRDMARRTADERAASFTCGRDEARIVGISSEWARDLVLREIP